MAEFKLVRMLQDAKRTVGVIYTAKGEHVCVLLEGSADERHRAGTCLLSELKIHPASHELLPRAAWHVMKAPGDETYDIPPKGALDELDPNGACAKLMGLAPALAFVVIEERFEAKP